MNSHGMPELLTADQFADLPDGGPLHTSRS